MASRGTLLLGVKTSSRMVSTPALASASVAVDVITLGTRETDSLPLKASTVSSSRSRDASPTLAVVCSKVGFRRLVTCSRCVSSAVSGVPPVRRSSSCMGTPRCRSASLAGYVSVITPSTGTAPCA